MDLHLTDEQTELQRIARHFLRARCPLSAVRQFEESGLGYSPELYAEMAALGWTGLILPKEVGGAGADLVDLYVIFKEIGRALAPSPLLTSAVLGGYVLWKSGAAAAGEVLPAILTGEAIAAPAWFDAGGTVVSSGGRLDGNKLLVPYANSATHFVVAASESGRSGASLFLVPSDRPGLALTAMPNLAGYPLFAVELADVEASERLGRSGQGWDLLGPALDRAAIMRVAEISGAGEAALEMSLEYATQRRQFGRPIGSFQAVQYMCSTMAIETHLTDLYGRKAAWHLDRSAASGRAVAMAKAQGAKAAQRIFREAHELHAGVAFMYEHDLQLFTRRARHWEYDLGDVRANRDAITETFT